MKNSKNLERSPKSWKKFSDPPQPGPGIDPDTIRTRSGHDPDTTWHRNILNSGVSRMSFWEFPKYSHPRSYRQILNLLKHIDWSSKEIRTNNWHVCLNFGQDFFPVILVELTLFSKSKFVPYQRLTAHHVWDNFYNFSKWWWRISRSILIWHVPCD